MTMSLTWQLTRTLALLTILVVFPDRIIAAEVWFPERDTASKIMVVEGEIVQGDLQRIRDAIYEAGPVIHSIYLFSPGGDAREAMKIGNMLRDLYLTTEVPNVSVETNRDGRGSETPSCENMVWGIRPKDSDNCTCNSACFLIWLGGLERTGHYVGVHRPAFKKEYYSSLGSIDAENSYENMLEEVNSYLVDKNVGRDIIEKMIETPSHEIHGMWADDLSGYPAFYEERMTAKCGALTREESGRYSGLRLKQEWNMITAEEVEQLEQLAPRVEKIEECRYLQYLNDRAAAFERYFGEGYIESWKRR